MPQCLQRHLCSAKSALVGILTKTTDSIKTVTSSGIPASGKVFHVRQIWDTAHVVLGDILRVVAELADWQDKLRERRVNIVMEMDISYNTTHDDEAERVVDTGPPPYSVVSHSEPRQLVAEIHDVMKMDSAMNLLRM